MSTKITTSLSTYELSKYEEYDILYIHTEKKKTSTCSTRNIKRDIERRLSKISFLDGLFIFVIGIAHLPLILHLIEQKKKYILHICIIEYDKELLKEIFSLFPSLKKQITFVISSLNSCYEFFASLELESFFGYKIIYNQIISNLAPTFYKKIENEIYNYVSSSISDLLTKMEFQKLWIFNSIYNIFLLEEYYPVSSLFDIVKGKKTLGAVLISAGPSLLKSLDFLKQAEKYLFISCVDAAYSILLDHNIHVDLVYTLDGQVFTRNHLLTIQKKTKNVHQNLPILVADFVSNPFFLKEWNLLGYNKVFLANTVSYENNTRVITAGISCLENSLLSFLIGTSENIINQKKVLVGDIQSGGSVATSLFDLLRKMSFTNIYLCGQDLAFTNYELHCFGNYYSRNCSSSKITRFETCENINFTLINKKNLRRVPAIIKDKEVVTDFILSLYADWFKNAALLMKDIQISNITFNGANLPPIQKILTSMLLEGFSTEMSSDLFFLRTILQNISSEKLIRENKKKLLNNFLLCKSLDDAKNTYDFLRYISKKYDFLLDRLDLTNSSNKEQRERLYLQKNREEEYFWFLLKKVLSLC